MISTCPSYTGLTSGQNQLLGERHTPDGLLCMHLVFFLQYAAEMFHADPPLAFCSFFVTTYGCQSTRAFTNCCTAADQADDEKKGPDSYYYNSRNQSVHIFKEVVVVIICDKHIGSNVAQNPSCSLQTETWKTVRHSNTQPPMPILCL